MGGRLLFEVLRDGVGGVSGCWAEYADLLSSLLVFFVCLVSCLFRYSVALGMTSRSMLPSTDRLDTLIFRHIGIDRRIGSLIMSLLDRHQL